MVRPGDQIEFYAHIIGKTPTANIDKYSPHSLGEDYYGYHSPHADGNTYIRISPVEIKVKWQSAHGRVGIDGNPQMIIEENTIEYNVDTGKCIIPITNPSGTKGGSAYVCAYNNHGDIVWSWHIWVTEDEVQTFDTGKAPVGKPNYQMQDRELGAIDKNNGANRNVIGMLYQWGRKDPYISWSTEGHQIEMHIYDDKGELIAPGNESEFTTNSRENSTIIDLVRNPSIIYSNDMTYPVPGTGDKDNGWWNPKVKTMYDPCPSGYMVSPPDAFSTTQEEWIIAVAPGYGFMWKEHYFRIGPYRNWYDTIGEDSYGRMWTSTSADPHRKAEQAQRFHYYWTPFTKIMFEPDNTSIGLNVRCIVDTNI